MVDETEADTCRFREVQRFTQVWLWAITLPGMLLCVGVMGYGMVEQLVFGRPWGTKPMSDAGLWVFGIGTIVLCGGVLALLAESRLITEMREDGLFIRFAPFHLRFKRIELEDVADCRAVTYRPVRGYGGWGIRFGPAGKAYNVRGDRGVKLEFVGGRRLLIGSQRAEELEEAILERMAAGPRAGSVKADSR